MNGMHWSRMVFPAAIVALAGAASAQVKDVTPYSVVVTADRAPLRADAAEVFYRVAEVEKGAVLRVDGEQGNWLRVSYPRNGSVFVLAQDGTLDAAAGTVRLNGATRLRAPNAVAGIGSSWKTAHVAPLAAGTTLKHLETMKGDDGAVLGYRVQAPDVARAFVAGNLVRKATDAEASGTAPAAPATTPAAAPSTTPATTPAATPATSPATAPSTTPSTTPAPATNLADPIRPGGSAPVVIEQQAPTNSQTTGSGVGAGTNTTAVTPVQPANQPIGQPVDANADPLSPEALDARFREINAADPLTAEYAPLIAQFEQAIAKMGNTPIEQRRAKQMETRLDILRLRKNYQDTVRRINEAKAPLTAANSTVMSQVSENARTRIYNVVGVLQPSSVYNGKNLPLMYRIQSVGGTSPRTLGYLKPDPALGLDGKLGRLIGVIGDTNLDPGLRLQIVTPVRIDLLKADGTPDVPTPAAATPAATPAPAPVIEPAPIRPPPANIEPK
jgi:hypothetical protein